MKERERERERKWKECGDALNVFIYIDGIACGQIRRHGKAATGQAARHVLSVVGGFQYISGCCFCNGFAIFPIPYRSLVFTDRLFFLLLFFGGATRHSLLQSTVGLIKEGAGRSKKRGSKQTERNCYHFFSSSLFLSSVYRSVPFDFVSVGEHLFAASVWVKDEPGGNECTDHF